MTSMSAITTAASTVVTGVGTVFDAMTSNPYLTVVLAAGFISICVGVFARL